MNRSQENWPDMSEPIEHPADKLWKDLTPQQVDHFFKLFSTRAQSWGDFCIKSWSDLANFLSTANAGAAAGIFLLLKSSPDQRGYLLTFFIFCAGTFFVGVARLVLNSWAQSVAEGFGRDVDAWGRSEMTVKIIDRNHIARLCSRKRMWVKIGIYSSFTLLIVGGIVAATVLWLEV
jgi:hypothetical protein